MDNVHWSYIEGGDQVHVEKSMDIERLKRSIKAHEGRRDDPYYNTAQLTAGWGHNLEETTACGESYADVWRNIRSDSQHEQWLDEDIEVAINGAMKYLAGAPSGHLPVGLTFWATLSAARQEVLVEMAFQMGAYGLAAFEKTREYIVAGDFAGAAREMLDSKWATQTPVRATTLSRKFFEG